MTPTAPLTTAAELARGWLQRRGIGASFPELRERDVKSLTAFLTTYAAQIRRDAIEECAKACEAVGREWRLGGNAYDVCGFTAMAIRALIAPGSPSSQTDTALAGEPK